MTPSDASDYTRVELFPSLMARGLLLTITAFVFIIAAYADFGVVYKIACFLFVSVIFLCEWRACTWLSVTELSFSGECLWLHVCDDENVAVEVTADDSWMPWLISFRYRELMLSNVVGSTPHKDAKLNGHCKKGRVVIWPDSCDARLHRKLRVFLGRCRAID